jgi:DNA-directed RNA polymerase subunit RPC12/RpoP
MEYMNAPVNVQATKPVVANANAVNETQTANQTAAQTAQPVANTAPAQNVANGNTAPTNQGATPANGGNVTNVAAGGISMPYGYANRPAPQKSPYYADDMEALTFRWQLDGKDRQVACPYCGQKIALTEGAPGYRCFNCGRVFRMEKPKKDN